MDYMTYNWMVFCFFILSTMVLLYQSWANVINKKLTSFSFDALTMLYIRILRGKNAFANAKKLLVQDPKRIRTLGIYAFCGALASTYIAIDWYFKYLH